MMNGFNITNLDQLLALMLHFGGEDLYDIFESLPEEEKARIPATVEKPGQDVFVRGSATLITSLQNRTQSIKDMNFADAYNCLQNH